MVRTSKAQTLEVRLPISATGEAATVCAEGTGYGILFISNGGSNVISNKFLKDADLSKISLGLLLSAIRAASGLPMIKRMSMKLIFLQPTGQLD